MQSFFILNSHIFTPLKSGGMLNACPSFSIFHGIFVLLPYQELNLRGQALIPIEITNITLEWEVK